VSLYIAIYKTTCRLNLWFILQESHLSTIPSGAAGAVWTSHCIEHLYAHEVGRALAEFHRVLSDDGFICIIVPDLQAVASYVAADRLHEALYDSPVGPITAHDILFGFGPAVAQGHTSMAHRCGFTPTTMLHYLGEIPFDEVIIRRRPSLELAAVARKKRANNGDEREALLAALEL
jgi:methyltransferase family protein